MIEDATVVERVLRHLGLPTQIPTARPARSPPLAIGGAPPQDSADDPVYEYDDPA